MRNLKSIGLGLAIVLGLGFGGCGDSGSSDSSTTTSGTATTYSLSGSAQKGPLIFGSYIWVAELDNQLNTTGEIHITQTTDDLGNFAVGSKINTQLVEIIADGYFMDETTGSLSSGKITLSAVADLKVDSSPTVNILTTLQGPRLTVLLETMNYEDALVQSQREVLAIFGIDASKISNLNGLFAMQINGSKDSDSVLLATSTIMMQMATIEAQSTGASKAAELTYLLSQIANDLSSDGVLGNNTIRTKLTNAATNVNLNSVRNNVQTYYSDKGVIITAPKFEEWVDKDGSGLLPRRQITFSDVSFTNLTDVEALQTYTSNAYTISGAGSDTYVYVDSNVPDSIIKNGSAVAGTHTTAVDGDTIAYKQTSLTFGESTSLTEKIGGISNTWSVVTRAKPTINYKLHLIDSPSGQYGGGVGGCKKYMAYHVQPTSTITSKYVGISMHYDNNTINSISVYSDNGNNPGTLLHTGSTTTALTNVSRLQDVSGNSYTIPPTSSQYGSSFSQGYFGGNGFEFQANTKYWIVIQANDGGYSCHTTDLYYASGGQELAGSSDDGINWSNYGSDMYSNARFLTN